MGDSEVALISVSVVLGVNHLKRTWILYEGSIYSCYTRKSNDRTRRVLPSAILMTMMLVGSLGYRYGTVSAHGWVVLTKILLMMCGTFPSYQKIM